MYTPREQTFTATPATVINMELDETPVFRHRFGQTYSRNQQSPPTISDKVSIQKFSGFSNENGKNFLSEFESFCVFQSLSDAKRKNAAFHLHLKGPALVWFNALDSDVKETWSSLKPARFRDSDHVDPNDLPTFSVSSDTDGFHKIKRVLGKRNSKYLVQIVGEPAENAIWVPFSALNAKAKRAIDIRPPPTL